MQNRTHDLEVSVGILTSALREISGREDCAYDLEQEKDRPYPCPCSKCTATRALEVMRDWRYHDARHDRIRHSPRERKIMDAWKDQVHDKLLAMILAEDVDKESEPPTPRDWYVASSVVQWLATNVGMEVLRKAGFEYKKWDEDREAQDQARKNR